MPSTAQGEGGGAPCEGGETRGAGSSSGLGREAWQHACRVMQFTRHAGNASCNSRVMQVTRLAGHAFTLSSAHESHADLREGGGGGA